MQHCPNKVLKLVVPSISLTSAPESVVTVASFRTWRGSQHIAAKRPTLVTITRLIPSQRLGIKTGGERGIRTLGTLLTYTRFPGVLLKPLGHLSGNYMYNRSLMER
jgi:hypothetical protein